MGFARMIFPNYAQISRYPGLVEWLEDWNSDDTGRTEEPRGVQVVEAQFVDGDPCDEYDALITAKVRHTNGRQYRVRVSLYADEWDMPGDFESGWMSECGCPEFIDCQHGEAVIHALKRVVTAHASADPKAPKARVSYKITEWLSNLRAIQQVAAAKSAEASKPAKPYAKFLAYCIEREGGTPENPLFRLTLRVGTRSKSGFSVDRNVATADPLKPTKYMTPEDIPICTAFQARCRRQGTWGSQSWLNGDGWEDILFPALETGRLVLGENKSASAYYPQMVYHEIKAAPALRASMGWRQLSNGNSRPVVELEPADDTVQRILLPITPAAYLDVKNRLLGPVDTGDAPPEFLQAWAAGPEVPAEENLGVCERLAALAPDNPPPLPTLGETETLRDLTPEAVLRITEVRTGVYLKRHIAALPEFRYPGFKPLPPLVGGAAPVAAWFDGKRRLELIRNTGAEAAPTAALAKSGLVPATNIFRDHDLNETARGSWFIDDPDAGPGEWIEYVAGEAAAGLTAAGWRIETDPKLGLTIHDLHDFFPAIEADPDHGIDWFRFDVTGEFEGKRVSLIPQIAKAIRSDLLEKHKDPETRPEFLLLPCDNPADGHIRFPANRFLEMVEQVRHLFHSRSGDGMIRLDRLGAAGVADRLEIESSETTRALAALGRGLREIDGLPEAPLPDTVSAELRPYQTEGYRWLRFLAAHGLHGILADDMGLGKTLQTIAHIAAAAAARPGSPSLVVAPTSVVPNWKAEFGKFAPSLKVLVLHGNDRSDHFQFAAEADVVVTSYPLLTRDFAELSKLRWHILVLDEAQYIKNPKSATAKNACEIKAAHRVCLSGTPMENHLGELWSLMRFLMPGFLADEKTFSAVFRKPIERDRSSAAQVALNRRVAPLILRRTKDQVAAELPEKTHIIHGIDLNPKQSDLYESVRAAMDKRVRDALAAKGLAQSHIIVLDALLKLRQICCHPQLLDTPAARKVTESAKLDYLTEDLLPTLIEEGRRILLFSQFTSMLALIGEHLETAEIPYLKLTGQTRERAKLVEDFQSGGYPVFLISLKAGGTGLNLTAADTVIHYDPWWNPAAENQATDRAHRIGQTKPVFVHKLVCRGTIEDRILDLQRHKSALVEALLCEDTAKLRIDEETLSHLLAPVDVPS